jgi:hypothetical protein
MRDQQLDGEWLGVAEAAVRLGLSVDSVRRRIRTDAISKRKVRRPNGFGWEVYVHNGASAPPGGASGASEPVPLHASAKLPTAAGAPPMRAGGEGEHSVRDDQMLVPREAWQRAMEQLGHFHELAEKYATTARELGKLETSEAFLRARLAELRAENERLRSLQERYDRADTGGIPVGPQAQPPRRPWWQFWG